MFYNATDNVCQVCQCPLKMCSLRSTMLSGRGGVMITNDSLWQVAHLM